MPASELAQSGLVVSPPDESPHYVEAWKNVLSLGDGLDDARLIAEFGSLSGITSDHIPVAESGVVEAYAEVRPRGSIETLSLRVHEPTHEHIRDRYDAAVTHPADHIEVVALRVRRYGRSKQDTAQ